MMECHLYTDGSWSSGGNGGWAYILDHEQTRSFRSGAGRMNDNNEAEIIAVVKGLEAIHAEGNEPPAVQVHIYSDSDAVRMGIRRALRGEKWGKGIREEIRERFRTLIAVLRPRCARVQPLPEAHRRCDGMARRARLAFASKRQQAVSEPSGL
jgi:ribonuclease HI